MEVRKPIFSIMMGLLVGLVLAAAGCEERKSEAPAFVAPLPEDPDNALNEYAAVAASEARGLIGRDDMDFNDPEWAPGKKLISLLNSLQSEIDRSIAASRRPRLDRVRKGQAPATVPPVSADDVVVARCLLRLETRRAVGAKDWDRGATTAAALLRMAKQVRTREHVLTFTVQCSTARWACQESARLDSASLSPEVRGELLAAARVVSSEPAYAGADRDEMTDKDYAEIQEMTKALIGRLEAGR